jgi:hypothetical protein
MKSSFIACTTAQIPKIVLRCMYMAHKPFLCADHIVGTLLLVVFIACYPTNVKPQQESPPPLDLGFQEDAACEQSLCTYMVSIFSNTSGYEAEQQLKSLVGNEYVELFQAQTYAGKAWRIFNTTFTIL